MSSNMKKTAQEPDPFHLPQAEREQRGCKYQGHAFVQAGAGGNYGSPATFGSDDAPIIVLFCQRCGTFRQRVVPST